MKTISKSLFVGAIVMLNGCTSQDASVANSAEKVPTNKHQQIVEQRLNDYEQNIDSLLSQMTLKEKVSLIHANTKFSIASIERLGIHEMWMSDGPHGVRYEISRHSWASAEWTDDYSTYLPNLTTVAASWDPAMATLHGNVLGSEARHRRKDLILGPGVNLARLPLYGRNFEYMGEDPFLAASLVVPEVKAIQKNDVGATVKHYALNTQELNRTGVDARPDERTLREVYLPAFEASVKEGGVHAIMGSYNQYMGTNANQSKHLVMDILKGEWGYDGVLLTDWNVDINSKDAAINGLDIEMGTNVESYDDYHMADPLIALIEKGEVPESAVDDKVRRILRVQYAIGMMDKQRISGQRNTAQHRADARKIATEGVVLLKNAKSVLPLNKAMLKNILVIGPNASKEHGAGGGSSEIKSLYEVSPLEGLQAALGDDVNITVMRARSSADLLPIASDYITSRHWTGTPAWTVATFADAAKSKQTGMDWIPDSAYVAKSTSVETIVMAGQVTPIQTGTHTLKASVQGDFVLKVNGEQVWALKTDDDATQTQTIELEGGKNYQFEISYSGNQRFTLGWDAPGNLFSPEQEYIAAAKAADAVIYFGGLSHGDDREAIDRPNMQLPNQQDEVISKLLKANPNTVVFIIGGSAVEMPWAEQANTLLWGWYSGMEAGHAFADVLLGNANPGGKMPITLPKALADTAPIMLDDYKADVNNYPEGVFIGYRWFEKKDIAVNFPFGHGLSYTEFAYSNIQLSTADLTGDEVAKVQVTVTNTGKREGAEIVQLYVNDVEASVERPIKELKGFAKVNLKAGESKTVTITLDKRDLSFWDVKSNDWLAETGEFKVLVGASLTDIRQQAGFNYGG
ncbi:glycoside hydrolase family 3 C-terminal domain-containing protein [Alteromonadaceae bacterium BrNp21-10]|nr:glycoside hydrolase family 3 C-terminal domain-containing protein [Alteromonadaceae bacterium BrNp21-10]